MNFGNIKQMVWSWLDDAQHTYFTDSQVSMWINNAQREAQKQLIQAGENYYTRRSFASLVANSDTYILPSDFMKVNKLELLTSGVAPNEVRQQIGFVTLGQLDRVSMTTGTPYVYTIRKNCIVIRPIPDSVKTIYLDYTYLVGDMSADTEIPDCPAQYHEYLAVLATIDGLLKDQRDPAPLLAKKDFYLSLMKQDAENRNVDYSREVVITDEPSIGMLF